MDKLIPPRRMLPRWRDSSAATATVEVQTPSSASNGHATPHTADGALSQAQDVARSQGLWESDLERELRAWKRQPDFGTAADLLSFAVYPQARERLRDVASFLLREHGSLGSAPLRAMAQLVLDDRDELLVASDTSFPPRDAIRRLRTRLRAFPANPVALADLAWVHASQGHVRPALRALLAAKSLAPANRHIVRALARFLVHTNEPAAAQRYLERAPTVHTDPWLMSALIAVSQITGRPTRILKVARNLVASRGVAPAHLSELAGSLATFELERGDVRTARRLFTSAVIEPNENVLAQLHWATELVGKQFEMREAWRRAPRAFELQTFDAVDSGDARTALEAALSWHRDEPYSSRPLVVASFLAEVLREHDKALDICTQGLRSDPNDAALENNLIYVLIAKGDLGAAASRLATTFKRTPTILALANAGYLYLRAGNEEEGRQYYEKAIELFEERKEFERAATALVFYARSLKETGHENWQAPLDRCRTAYQTLNSPTVTMLISALASSAGIDMKLPPVKASVSNSRAKWRYDNATHTLFLKPAKLL